MSDVLIDQDTMEDIGDSIRSKLGVQTTYLPSEMPNAIMSISGGGSAKYSETVLWENSSGSSFKPENPVIITLSDSISNYEMLAFIFSTPADRNYRHTSIIPVSCIEKNGNFFNSTVLGGNVYNAPACAWISDTSIKLYGYSSNYPMICYKIIGIKWETMQTALIYSEEEREVGVWIDGKPLYQKTINFGALPLTATKTVAHNIADVDKIWVYDGFVYGTSGIYYQLNRTTNSFTYQWETRVDSTNVVMQDFAAFGNDHSAIITLQYTKTTDTAGSGIWTTTGEYAHHYSTNEHIVGTWVDGSTLYEKTIVINNPASGGDWVEYDIGVPNLNKVIKQEGTWDRDVGSSGIWTYDLNAVNELSLNNNYIVNARIRNGTKKLAVYVGSQYSCPQLRFTFQYTKTT